MEKSSLPIFRIGEAGAFKTATLLFPLFEGDGEIEITVRVPSSKGASAKDAEQVAKITVVSAAQSFVEGAQELVPQASQDAICALSYASHLVVAADQGKDSAKEEITKITTATNGAVEPLLKAALGFMSI